MKTLKDTMENDPEFKIFYGRKLAHANDRESRKFLCEQLPSSASNEMISDFNEHFSQWINEQSFTREISSDPLLTRLIDKCLLDFPTDKCTEKLVLRGVYLSSITTLTFVRALEC